MNLAAALIIELASRDQVWEDHEPGRHEMPAVLCAPYIAGMRLYPHRFDSVLYGLDGGQRAPVVAEIVGN
jgi:hypothetical protein